ncbi:MAG: orotate phosphoribosyltransferase [Lunatimonas sp.]|uniref:orotate phosphoribosyltransferase n=1 Tax=Lunatimonas sp. TaxID=2060141 RepID=UPI00263BD412|nr:orotate phosphoribosyltransferase [Lunatimonas sp.]MCC5939049.1 orotate phosphoribosyltransferase [Lunatimonas sp.]
MEIQNENTATKIAQHLLEIKAIRLKPQDPFTWASGWKSPIYCDNRLALSYPPIRTYIKEQIAEAIHKHFGTVEAIAGVATAGIPQGALVADAMQLPFLYVRSKPKGHGMENMIEGKITPEQKVVVIEDLVSTGGSSLKAVEDLRGAGFDVLGMISIFTYGFEVAKANFEQAKVKLICLSDYEHMLPQAVRDAYVSEEDLATLQQWRLDPGSWKP